MAISTLDIKILWGRAGGMCSRPDCREDLTTLLETGNYVIGEMAHVIGRKPSARRGGSGDGEDTYDNLILLCPTHHTHIDKAPEGTYPAELLHKWKNEHESAIRMAGDVRRFTSFDDLRTQISRLLNSNRTVFEAFGPRSEFARDDPASNLFSVWELRRLDRIVPNNRSILRLIDSNTDLVPPEFLPLVEQFRVHVDAYELHVYDKLDSYPLFPELFAETFG